jgi:hypothetical protein
MPETPKFSPAALLAFLLSPVVLVFVVLATIAGALWYFKIASPGAIAAGVIVLVLAAALFFGGVYLAKRRDKRAVEATIAGMTDTIGAQDNTPQARERVAKLRAKWERLFKNVRPEYVKAKPILMIVGESKSGKSVLLDRSGLELESGNRQERDWEEGTENVDPWFFPDGLVLDTAGEMVAPAAGSARIDWPELVKLIKTLRPRNPVSGVILAVPVWRLLSDDESERIKQANLFQREFQRLVQLFGVRFPVSVVVTMADLIDGYSEFALRQSAARIGDKYTILGWPQYQLADEFGGRDVMAESVAGVTSRIEAQVLYDTCNPETTAVEGVEALEIWCFPKHIRTIGQRLAGYLKLVFKEKQSERVANAPFFRGVFFGSAMQSIRRGEPRRKEPERPRSEPFNIRDLLAIRLFGEAGLVTTSPRAEAAARTRRLVGVAVPLGVAAISAAIALIAFDLAGRVSQQKEALQAIAARLEKDATTPWISAAATGGVKVDDTLAGLLAQEFSAARGFRVADLPPWLGWYRGFALKRGEAATAATDRAWTKLIAMPLLEAAARENAWLTGQRDGLEFAYRSRELEKKRSNSAPERNADLLELDQELVAAMGIVGLKSESLRLRSGATNTTFSPSLAPITRALMGKVPQSVGAGDLLAPSEGWVPPARANELAQRIDTLRARFLAEKIKDTLDDLVLAANTHAAWRARQVQFSQVGSRRAEFDDDDSDAERSDTDQLTWESVKQDVWDTLDELSTSPSNRLATVAGWVGAENSLATVTDLFPAQKNDRAAPETADDANKAAASNGAPTDVDLRQRIADLDALYQARGDGYPETIDAVVARIMAVRGSEYAPGELSETVALDLKQLWLDSKPAGTARASEGVPPRDGDEDLQADDDDPDDANEAEERRFVSLRRYATPATREFHRAVAGFLSSKVGSATMEQTSSVARGTGVRAPVSDFSTFNAIKRKDDLARDLGGLTKWHEGQSGDRKKEFAGAFNGAKDRLTQLSNAVQSSLAQSPIVATSGFEPGAAATEQFVVAVLQKGAETVGEIAGEIAAQSARIEGKSDPAINAARDSAVDAAKRGNHAELRDAVLVLSASIGQGSATRATVAQRLAQLDSRNEFGGKVARGIAAVSNLPTEERRYWNIFWRDLLIEAAKFRDDEQSRADLFVAQKTAGFPLTLAATTVVSPGDVLQLAQFGAASRPTDAIEVASVNRPTASLVDLWNHRRVPKDRTSTQETAIRIAELLAQSEGALVPEAVALRLSVRATGDWELLSKLGAVAEFAPNRVEADSANRIAQQLLLERAASSGVERVSCTVTRDFDPAVETRFDWPLVGAADSDDAVQSGMSVTFAVGELGTGRQPRAPLSLDGGAWSALRLARELSPIALGAQALTKHDGFAWGAIRAVDLVEGAERERELYVALGLKLEWVLKDGTTKPVDLTGWLRAVK